MKDQRQLPVPLDKFFEAMGRAKAENVILEPAPRSDVVMVASRLGSKSTYLVGPDSCSCAAGQKSGAFCKHRAAWIYAHIDEYATSIADEYMRIGKAGSTIEVG